MRVIRWTKRNFEPVAYTFATVCAVALAAVAPIAWK